MHSLIHNCHWIICLLRALCHTLMDCGNESFTEKSDEKLILAVQVGLSLPVPKLLSKLMLLISELLYLLLREKLSVRVNLAVDSRLTFPLQERCSMLCVGCQNIWCVVNPWLLLWEFCCSQGTKFLREEGFLRQRSLGP